MSELVHGFLIPEVQKIHVREKGEHIFHKGDTEGMAV